MIRIVSVQRLAGCGLLAMSMVASTVRLADAEPVTDSPSSILPGRPDAPAATAVPGTPTTAPAETGQNSVVTALGPVFESQAAGISLRVPAGMKPGEMAVNSTADNIAQWVDPQRDWVLRLNRITLKEPRPLTSVNVGNKTNPGMIDVAVDNLKHDIFGCQVLRQDVTNIAIPQENVTAADARPLPNVGIIAVRYTSEARRRLTQEALIHASDQLYFVLTLTSPAIDAKAGPDAVDPREREAVDAIQQVLDGVKLLDRGAVRKDQDNRLFRTRSFYVNLSPSKLREVLIPEQWFRVLLNGKDIGYTYVVEQQSAALPKPQPGDASAARLNGDAQGALIALPRILPGQDILIGVRSRITLNGRRTDKTTGPVQTDSESWLFVTADRKHEDWSRLIVQDDFKSPKKQFSEELGSMDEHLVDLKSGASLTVTQNANAVNLPPIEQQLPPFYLPQAMGHLLPRLLPVKSPRTYLFASFIGETRQVMMRYIDVGAEQRVNLDGKLYDVIPIADRIGFDGLPTVHYVAAKPDADGRHQYLGSENKETHVLVLASDAATIQQLWSKANR